MSVSSSSIGAKIFGAFLAMSLIIAALGLYGYGVLGRAGDMVVGTFDGPLMAINYARAANFDFVQMQNKLLQRARASATQKAALDSSLDDLVDTFNGDLAVARQRSDAPDELAVIGQIEALFRQWNAARRVHNVALIQTLQDRLDDRFDMLVELNTDHSFVARRKAVWAIAWFKYVTAASIGAALLLSFAITAFLARRIVKPLSAAASVADRISRGEFETPIPTGGKDETGVLLHSMTVMQDNIRSTMAREAERRRSAENRLVDALETSHEGVVLVSPEGRVLIVNSQFRNFFPKVAERLAPGMEFAKAFRLVQSQLMQTPLEDAIDLSKGYVDHQLADGRWVRFTVSGTSEGGSIVFVSDFTDLKEREASYRLAKQEAEAASAAKSRFLANMGHELRTPLNAIIGFSEMIASEVFGAVGHARYKDYAGDILRSGKRLLDVINDVLEIARSQTGNAAFDASDIDLVEVLTECAQVAREDCEANKLDFRFSVPGYPLTVRGDGAKLRQIFSNLLSNARKFNSPGGFVSLSARQDADRVTVTVADSGIGMSGEEIVVALTPFGQADARLERRYEGAGLGLPLSKALVERHGGVLRIESAPGTGTSVTVEFPAAVMEQQRLAG